MGISVRELAEQVQRVEGFPIVILATQDFDLGDIRYESQINYDAYAGDLARRLSLMTDQKIVLYVMTADGRMLYSNAPHMGSQDRLDMVREGWTDKGRMKALLKHYGLKVNDHAHEDEVILELVGDEQDRKHGDGNIGYCASFEFDIKTGKFQKVWTGFA